MDENRYDEKARYQALKKTSLITVVVNVALAAAKAVAGFLSGSMAVLSDAVHTLSDVFTTLMVILGLKISSREADDSHPYGHQRIESIISLFLAVTLALTALLLAYEGIGKLMERTPARPSWLALGVTVSSIVSKEWMFRYTRRKARQYRSTSMMADAWHHRTDSVSSVAVLVGVAGAFFGLWFLEPVATLAVCALILKAAFDIGKAAGSQLTDRSASGEIRREIEQIALSVEGVRRIDLLKTRVSSHIIFVELEISVPSSLTVSQGHDIAERVHDRIEARYDNIGHCAVHVNPDFEDRIPPEQP